MALAKHDVMTRLQSGDISPYEALIAYLELRDISPIIFTIGCYVCAKAYERYDYERIAFDLKLDINSETIRKYMSVLGKLNILAKSDDPNDSRRRIITYPWRQNSEDSGQISDEFRKDSRKISERFRIKTGLNPANLTDKKSDYSSQITVNTEENQTKNRKKFEKNTGQIPGAYTHTHTHTHKASTDMVLSLIKKLNARLSRTTNNPLGQQQFANFGNMDVNSWSLAIESDKPHSRDN